MRIVKIIGNLSLSLQNLTTMQTAKYKFNHKNFLRDVLYLLYLAKRQVKVTICYHKTRCGWEGALTWTEIQPWLNQGSNYIFRNKWEKKIKENSVFKRFRILIFFQDTTIIVFLYLTMPSLLSKLITLFNEFG